MQFASLRSCSLFSTTFSVAAQSFAHNTFKLLLCSFICWILVLRFHCYLRVIELFWMCQILLPLQLPEARSNTNTNYQFNAQYKTQVTHEPSAAGRVFIKQGIDWAGYLKQGPAASIFEDWSGATAIMIMEWLKQGSKGNTGIYIELRVSRLRLRCKKPLFLLRQLLFDWMFSLSLSLAYLTLADLLPFSSV